MKVLVTTIGSLGDSLSNSDRGAIVASRSITRQSAFTAALGKGRFSGARTHELRPCDFKEIGT